jgi:FAD/FMN-containing dehydrogenase/Fe-S oxidoreductase
MQELPASSHGKPVDVFADAAALEIELRRAVKGEVRFDRGSRAMYAVDGSNYRQIPIGLVIPKDKEDVIAAVAACRKFDAPILARGGGTSLAGQCCNVAVVLDFSKYMHALLELNPEKGYARVQPGIVLDTLRSAAEKYHLTFAPDPSTHNRCTLGGMIGNNSCGVHGLMGGKTVDNVEELEILLYDGSVMTVGPTDHQELARVIAAGGRKGQLYAGLKQLVDQYGDLVRQKFPDIPRRVSGYNLDDLLPEKGFHVARALVGTEGTCALILEAKVRLVRSPQHKSLVVLGYPDAYLMSDHVPAILEHKPIGLEGFDGTVVEVMRQKKLLAREIALLPPGSGFLLIEFGDDDLEAAHRKADKLVAWIDSQPDKPQARIFRDPAEVRAIWKVRESGNGGTTVIPGEPSVTHEGWEDAAVHPRALGAYLRDLKKLLDHYGLKAWYYGHFGEGCIHMRINFDLESVEGVRQFRRFVQEAGSLVIRYGGSVSGEHGDGQARAFLYPKMFGRELCEAFAKFKRLWDPNGKMNPRKLIDSYEPEENLKLGADYHVHHRRTHFHFPDDQGSLDKALQRCVGIGACRKKDAGIMCPSYQVTFEEKHSTRGRAHLLWEMLQGEIIKGGWRDHEVKESLDLCLACKGCKGECPVNVDVATYKAEFLSHYYAARPRPLNHYAFGMMDKWARLSSIVPGLVNAVNDSPLSHIAKSLLRIAQSRKIPKFAQETFVSWLKKQPGHADHRSEVVLFADTWNNYFHPHVSQAAYEVLRQAGFTVHVPQAKGHLCCGRPLYDFGLLRAAKKYLLRLLDKMKHEIDAGLPVIVLEPSCASVFRDELRNLLPHHGVGQRLRRQTFTLSGFLQTQVPGYEPPKLPGQKVILHGHCHHKALLNFTAEEALLKRMGVELKSLESGCCGMAGSFGFERDKLELSQALGERVLLSAVRAAGPDDIVLADGFSCREQITQNIPNRQPRHLAEVLQIALRQAADARNAS